MLHRREKLDLSFGVRMISFAAITGVILVLCPTQACRASPTECQEAISQYKSAMEDISTALRTYRSFLSNTDGHDDCSTEFATLKSAQDDLEEAVSNYGSDCN